MADPQDIIKELEHSKVLLKQHKDSIKWGRATIEEKVKKLREERKKEVKIKVEPPRVKSKEEIYQELKDRYRNAWKAPGYVSNEFSKVPVLKAAVLSTWEYERALMPERSHKAPIGFKGFKTEYYSREFGYPDESLLPPLYRKHLEEFKLQFDDFTLRPSKYGKVTEDIKIENLGNKSREMGWRLVNSAQSKDFLFDTHSQFQTEIRARNSDIRFHSQTKTTMNNHKNHH